MEHSGWSFETVKQQIAQARGAGLAPIVNPRGGPDRSADRQLLLDLGALGLMVAQVESRAEAEAIVRATRCPPAGSRGAAFGVAHDGDRIGDPAATIRLPMPAAWWWSRSRPHKACATPRRS